MCLRQTLYKHSQDEDMIQFTAAKLKNSSEILISARTQKDQSSISQTSPGVPLQ